VCRLDARVTPDRVLIKYTSYIHARRDSKTATRDPKVLAVHRSAPRLEERNAPRAPSLTSRPMRLSFSFSGSREGPPNEVQHERALSAINELRQLLCQRRWQPSLLL